MDAVGASGAARTIPAQARASIKLKLKFAEPEGILSRGQLQECLEQCWILLPSSCTTVGDVSAFITRSFDLCATCPNGISLAMEGFTLPFSQSADLLQDSDLVHVRRLKVSAEVERAYSSLANHHRHVDGPLYDEADPTTASLGYRLHGSEVKKHSKPQSSGFRRDLLESHTEHDELRINWRQGELPLEPRQSKHVWQNAQREVKCLESPPGKEKGSVMAGEHVDQSAKDSADQQQTLEEDPCVATRVKRRKKKQLRTEPTSAELVVVRNFPEQYSDDSPELVEAPPTSLMDKVVLRSKRKEPSSRKAASAEIKEDSAAGREAQIVVESAKNSRKRQDTECVSRHHDISTSQADKKSSKKIDEHKRKPADSSDRSKSNENKKMKLTETQVETLRPSRSARRKKAKRRWMREQAEAEKQAGSTPYGVGDQFADEMEASEDEEEGLERGLENELSYNVAPSLAGNEDERQDSVPVVDRPGHIRFEAWNDKDGVERRTLPDVKLGMAILSKKQGQVWGQAKDVYKHEKKWSNPRDDSRVLAGGLQAGVRSNVHFNGNAAATITNFEALPAMDGNPVEGDVLAYRLVELSASWTPVLSVYRVGKVGSYDPTSKGIVLKPVDEYPLRGTFVILPEREDSSPEPEEFAFPTPFSSDGSLETRFTELVNVHLVQKAGEEKKTSSSTVVPTDITSGEPSNGGDLDEAAHNCAPGENHTILKLKAQPAQHRSVRGLRAAALGPALARLRAQQEL